MGSRDKIYSFDKITLRSSGMRVTEEYEIVRDRDRAVISLYTIMYSNGSDDRRLEKSVISDSKTVIELLDTCGVMKWDGFSGKNPPHIRDGIMFTFIAQVNDGRAIRASGSNNFPKHYRDFIAGLSALLMN